MEQHTAKRLRYSFLFLLFAIVLLIFVIFAQSQIIFGQVEDMMGETPKEIITECGDNELATLGANGLRCKTVEATRTPTTRDINITYKSCPFGIKNFSIDPSSTLSYTCVKPVECSENQFLSVQADSTFICINYNSSNLKDKLCIIDNLISGFDDEGVPICTTLQPVSITGISCPGEQYIAGVKSENQLYMILFNETTLYTLRTEDEGSPGRTHPVFGGEDNPRSITSHNGKLYMVGWDSASLYELDTIVSAWNPATIVGTTFEDVEDAPISITSHNGKLYMVGQDSASLYELDTEEAGNPAKIVGTTFEDVEDTPVSITSHNGKLYMIGIGHDSASLYVLDTEATDRSPATIVGTTFEDIEDDPRSITSHNGKLYMVGSGSDSLYELDTEEAGNPATIVGTTFEDLEARPQSITSHNGKLYMIGNRSNSSSGSLYVLDTEATRSPITKRISRLSGAGVSIASHITGRGIEPFCRNF